METDKIVLSKIFAFFVNSKNFNGILLARLSEETSIAPIKLIEIIRKLLLEDLISIQLGVNPHIIRIEHYTTELQREFLDKAENDIGLLNQACVYPSKNYLTKHRDTSQFSNTPFTLSLTLGEPQLKPLFFEIETLVTYSKNPQFTFHFSDYSGNISYTDSLNEKDQILLQSFGLGSDENGDRVLAVYLCYLTGLTPEHQILWKNKEITTGCEILKEYYDHSIQTTWDKPYSVFSAFLEEQKTLNDLATEIFDIPLFNKTFDRDSRPKEFNFLFIPTLKEYNDFVSLLDKMISENIKKTFFKDSLELYDLKEIKHGVWERKEKGTLRLLEEWLSLYCSSADLQKVKELLNPFRKIRAERQLPAHKIINDEYDKILIEKQKELIKEAYYTMNTLRHIFQRHPKGKNVKIAEWLDSSEIKIF